MGASCEFLTGMTWSRIHNNAETAQKVAWMANGNLQAEADIAARTTLVETPDTSQELVSNSLTGDSAPVIATMEFPANDATIGSMRVLLWGGDSALTTQRLAACVPPWTSVNNVIR